MKQPTKLIKVYLRFISIKRKSKKALLTKDTPIKYDLKKRWTFVKDR